jgi:universal stress protein A
MNTLRKKGITMKIKPTSNTGGVLVELRPEETQLPAQSVATAPEFKLKTILVPMDFSDCSKKALQYACPFAKQFGAELKLLHVIEPYPAVSEMVPYDHETGDECRQKLQELQKALGDAIPCSIELRTGISHVEIANAARELGADLIILSTHGRQGFARMILGSTTEKVVRFAPCPVLIVRECEREFIANIENSP